jgi:Flp pilus assembly protein TadG
VRVEHHGHAVTRFHRVHGGKHARRGQGLVEFSLVFPIIVLILFGIIDLGRGVYAYNTIASAARVGARVAIVNQIQSTPAGECNQSRPIENPGVPHWSVKTCAANSAISLGVQTSAVTVTYNTPPNTTLACSPALRVGCIARVTVTYSYVPSTPVIGGLVGTIAMSSTSELPVERVFP